MSGQGSEVDISNGHRSFHSVQVPSLRGAMPALVNWLLGRTVFDLTDQLVDNWLAGRRVLVTGAGGSIGSELCRQVSELHPAELLMLDRDESALHALKLSLDGRATMDTPDLLLADIRDTQRMSELFEMHRPDVVLHAAALKHVPLLEITPTEAVRTNLIGTADLLDLALEHGVSNFVNVSTDKAASPVNVLGTTKRLAECATANAALGTSGKYISVRFGNVLGSRGSLLETFLAQIEAGGPVTVTDPEVSRFFMSVEDAVHLVLNAVAVGINGACHVLEMGEPFLIREVAERLIQRDGRAIEIVYTGLRQGEKLVEEVLSPTELVRATGDQRIKAVGVPPLPREAFEHLTALRGADALRNALLELADRCAHPMSVDAQPVSVHR